MKIRVKKLNPKAKIPRYAHPGDAGMDFFSLERVVLRPGERNKCSTGIALEIQEGYVGLVWDKSGVAGNYGIKTMAGVVDSGYRGEIMIALVNLSKEVYTINAGDKIAQMLIQKIECPEIEEVQELSDTKRGKGGFGSTGIK